MPFVIRVPDRLEVFHVAPRTTDVLRRARTFTLEDDRIGRSLLTREDLFDQDFVLPVVASLRVNLLLTLGTRPQTQ
jgi:hypothetical protein